MSIPLQDTTGRGMLEVHWARCSALAAAEQAPLLDAQLEGERALHWLETLPPAAAWSELTSCGLAAAARLLLGCRSSCLPATQPALEWWGLLITSRAGTWVAAPQCHAAQVVGF